MLDVLVQSRRDKQAAKRLLRKLLKGRAARLVSWSRTSCRYAAAKGEVIPRSSIGGTKALYGDIDVKVRVQRQRSSRVVGREDGYELIRGELAIGRAGHRAATLYPVGLVGPEP